MADREPSGAAGRPSDEMQSDEIRGDRLQPVRPPLATPHSSHDLLLLAAATDRDADPALRAEAAEQAAACDQCAALAAELRMLASGLADLPASRPVPRDMRITREQAAGLRRRGFWPRLLRPFGADGLPALRPLAATLTTLGIAGILLTAFPVGLAGTASSYLDHLGSAVGPMASAGGPVPAALASPATEQQGRTAKGATPIPGQSPAAAPGSGTTAGPADDMNRFSAMRGSGLAEVVPRLPPLTWLSLGLVAIGLGLFALVVLARRIV